MPLSKARDRIRKRKERASFRLDGTNPHRVVQPIVGAVSPSIRQEGYGKASSTVIPQIDADGNVIPNYDD